MKPFASQLVALGGSLLLLTGVAESIDLHDFVGRDVCLTGVVADVVGDQYDPSYSFLSFKTPQGTFCAIAREETLSRAECRAFIDAEAVVCGRVANFEPWRESHQPYINLVASSNIALLAKAPADPFAVTADAPFARLHRQPVAGTVLQAGRRRLYLKTTSAQRILEVLRAEPAEPLPAGQRVTVAGFLGRCATGYRLTEALVRPVADDIRERPVVMAIEPKDLFAYQRWPERVPAEGLIGRTVRITGTVETTQDTSRPGENFILNCGVASLLVDISDIESLQADAFEPKSRVEVTGLCLFEFSLTDSTSPTPRFQRFTVIPSAATDIRLVARPPWWTTARLLTVIGALAAALLGIILWNVSLRVFAERRGRELLRAQIDTLSARLKVEERTRMAVELHDSVAQTLSCIAMELAAAKAFDTCDGMRRHVVTADKALSTCRDEVRNHLWDLRSNALEEPSMDAAIRRSLRPHVRNVALSVDFAVPRRRFSDNTAHEILKMIRELVINAIRHGRASAVEITGATDGDRLVITVRDNGCGFDPETAPGILQGHFGIEGVRERARRLHGRLTYAPATPRGTNARLTLPMTTASREPPDTQA